MVCANGVFSQMQKSGKIINISSSTTFWGTPNCLHYVASKAALIGMTRSLAREGRHALFILAISHGFVPRVCADNTLCWSDLGSRRDLP